MQDRCSQDSRATGPAPAGAAELEPGLSRRAAKARRVAPAHSGHRSGTRGSGRADSHAEPRRRPPSPTAPPGSMEPGTTARSAEPAARHGDGRKKMAAAVAAATAASHAPLTPMARAGRRAADGGGPGSGEGRGEAARGPAGGGGRAGGWREVVAGTVCGARNMAGVCDAAAPGEGGGGGADGPERTSRGEAEQPGGGGHGPAPQHTETLGFYESDRRREKRRGRAGEAGGERASGQAGGARPRRAAEGPTRAEVAGTPQSRVGARSGRGSDGSRVPEAGDSSPGR